MTETADGAPAAVRASVVVLGMADFARKPEAEQATDANTSNSGIMQVGGSTPATANAVL